MATRRDFRIQAPAILAEPSQLKGADAEWLRPREIVVSHGQIVEISSQLSGRADLVLDNYALIPGLVNAHTHLEFSDCQEPLPTGPHFPAWIENVLRARRARADARKDSTEQELVDALRESLDRGLCESQRFGVTALADVVTPPWSPQCLPSDEASPCAWHVWPEDLKSQFPYDLWLQAMDHLANPTPMTIACLEQIGLTEKRFEPVQAWCEALQQLELDDYPESLHSMGIAPHAPYSTHSSLLASAMRLASSQNRLAVVHLAESLAERQWIDEGIGPFVDFHRQFSPEPVPRRPSMILEWIDQLSQAPRGLVIHGNYLSESEMDAIARANNRLSVVYCPRTHRHFQHDAYPLAELKKRGIRVLLGTDSRSTNPDLNLWAEAAAAIAKHPDFRPTDAFASITDQAAEALGIGDLAGSLSLGNSASLCALPIPQASSFGNRSLDEVIAHWLTHAAHPIPIA